MIRGLARKINQQPILQCTRTHALTYLKAAHCQYQKANPYSEDFQADHLTGLADALAE